MKRILVVDDEKDVEVLFRQQFRKAIKSEEISFLFAFSGLEALSMIGELNGADLVMFTDINMPGMTGLELLEKVKHNYPELKVYIISAYDLKEYHDSAKQLGAVEFIPKPIDFAIIKDKISNIDL